MSEQENIDVGRVIGLIMENPEIIEQISGLMKQKDKADNPTESQPEPTPPKISEQASAEATVSRPSPISSSRSQRAQLLGALKPYVSEERAKAIDSMISIADILELMKAR